MAQDAAVGEIVQRYVAVTTRLAEIEPRLKDIGAVIQTYGQSLGIASGRVNFDNLRDHVEEGASLYDERATLLRQRRSIEMKMGELGVGGLIEK